MRGFCYIEVCRLALIKTNAYRNSAVTGVSARLSVLDLVDPLGGIAARSMSVHNRQRLEPKPPSAIVFADLHEASATLAPLTAMLIRLDCVGYVRIHRAKLRMKEALRKHSPTLKEVANLEFYVMPSGREISVVEQLKSSSRRREISEIEFD